MKITSLAILLLAVLFSSCKKTEILHPETAISTVSTPKTATIGSSLTITGGTLLVSNTAEFTVNLEITVSGFTSRPPQSVNVDLCKGGGGGQCRRMVCVLGRVGTTSNSAVYTGSFTFDTALILGEQYSATASTSNNSTPHVIILLSDGSANEPGGNGL